MFNFNTYIIESSTREHKCFDSQFFTSLIPLPVTLHITLPNSFRIIVTHTGSAPILPNLTLHNVLFVSIFKCNLLFVNNLCSQNICDLHFPPSCWILQGYFMKNSQVFGGVKDNLYLLEHASPKSMILSKIIVSFPKGSNSISNYNFVSFQS